MVTPSKEVSAFESSNNQTSINTNLTEIMNVSKQAQDLKSEENGPDLNRPLSELMSDATELSKTQHQRDLSNEIGSGLISTSGLLKQPKKSIAMTDQESKSPMEFDSSSKIRLGTGEKHQTISIARSEKRSSHAVNGAQTVIASVQQLSVQKKPLKIQQTAPNNIRRNIPSVHPTTLQHVSLPSEQKRKSEPMQKLVSSIAAI